MTYTHTPRALHDVLISVLRLILLCAALMVVLDIARPQAKTERKPTASQDAGTPGKPIFVRYCASCHGVDGQGDGPAATAMNAAPPDLTRLAKRHEGKYPAGYVGAVLKFGKSLASHGSEDMPVWGRRFEEIDPVHDPTGQQHIDILVRYIGSLQAK